jgi:copper chaperone CopZ
MKTAKIQLETLTCPSCLQKIENALKGLEGVETDSIKVLFNASKAKLNFDEEVISIDDIKGAITTLGFKVEKSSVKAA